MVYDCFTFFSETDLLEIRFNELDPYVDFFVVVEARERFDGVKKDLFYGDNKSRFEKFNAKVIHIGLDILEGKNLEERGTWQCNQIMRGLTEAKDTDVILISDGDEIPRGTSVRDLEWVKYGATDIIPFRPFSQTMYMYYLNWFWTHRWNGTVATTYQYLAEGIKTPRRARLGRRHGSLIRTAGWHFSGTGGVKNMIARISCNYHLGAMPKAPDPKMMAALIHDKQVWGFGRTAKSVPMDGSFPKYLMDNLDKFKHLIGEAPCAL